MSGCAAVEGEEWKALDWSKTCEVISGAWAVETKRASQMTQGECAEPQGGSRMAVAKAEIPMQGAIDLNPQGVRPHQLPTICSEL